MAIESEDDATCVGKAFRFRFSLLALLIFITCLSLGLAWLVQPVRVVATALFQVSSGVSDASGVSSQHPFNREEYDLLKKTQVAMLKSDYVLMSAIRNPAVGSMTLLANKADPVEWLQQHLDIEFPGDGEVLAIKLHGTESQSTDLVVIMNAVVKAYQDEVISAMRQRRTANRDLLSRELRQLDEDIKKKRSTLLDIRRESGKGTSGDHLDVRIYADRLERLDAEVMRLESEQALADEQADATRIGRIGKRLAELRGQRSDLQSEFQSSGERSAEHEILQREVDRLQRIADDLTIELEEFEIRASAGQDRIRMLQPAVISRE